MEEAVKGALSDILATLGNKALSDDELINQHYNEIEAKVLGQLPPPESDSGNLGHESFENFYETLYAVKKKINNRSRANDLIGKQVVYDGGKIGRVVGTDIVYKQKRGEYVSYRSRRSDYR